MSNYTKSTNFAAKDALASGNAAKIVKGTEIDTEFNNIATAIATKSDANGGTFTGTVNFNTIIASETITATTIVGNLTGNVTGNVTGNTSGSAGSLATTNWTISETSGELFFKYGGVSKMKLDSSGNLSVVGNMIAYTTL